MYWAPRTLVLDTDKSQAQLGHAAMQKIKVWIVHEVMIVKSKQLDVRRYLKAVQIKEERKCVSML